MEQQGQPEPEEVWHAGDAATARLASLGLTKDDLDGPLKLALADARLCTELDSPGAAGFIFWTRTNRYLREQLGPHGWRWTNRDNILRTVHPDEAFTITAMSGAGAVGIERGRVRTRNPKGAAVDLLVRYNYVVHGGPRNKVPLWEEPETFEPGMLPTWFLLYQLDDVGRIRRELSLPVDMLGKVVNQWREHILLPTIEPGNEGPVIGGLDIFNGPDGDQGPDVSVERIS